MEAKESAWYDEFYREAQSSELSPWYRFAAPHLRTQLNAQTKIIELGCGQAHLLRSLAKEKILPEENIYAIDQSGKAVEWVQKSLPQAHISTGDIYKLAFPKDFFQVCLLMETIEHLEEPMPALANIFSVIAPGGLLYLSFPNYLHLPWLAVRILAEKLNRPNWVVLQPVDKIYTVFGVIKLLEQAGFQFETGIGSNYGPPVFYPLETDALTRFLNKLGLWRFSFHPILVFRKPSGPQAK